MEIEYELTPDDLYYFQLRSVKRSKYVKRSKIKLHIYLLLTLFVFGLLPAFSGRDFFDFSRASFSWILVTYPLIAVLWWFLERRGNRSLILDLLKKEKPGRGQLGSHKIVLNEQGLVESTAVGESRTSWAGVDRIEQDREYIFIYTAPNAAHVIPKRSFNSVHEAEAFYQLATACKQTATLAS